MKTFSRPKRTRGCVIRSFAISAELLEEAKKVVPPEAAANLNQVVTLALRRLVASYRKAQFEREMADMATDEELGSVSKSMAQELKQVDSDGL